MPTDILGFVQDCLAHERKVSLVDTRFCIANFGEQYRAKILSALRTQAASVHTFEGSLMNAARLLNALLSDGNASSHTQQPGQQQSANENQLSVYKQLAKALRDKKSGAVIVDSAHLLDAQTAKLLDQLVSHCKKHNLDWCFILVTNQYVFETVHPRRFLQANRVTTQIDASENAPQSRALFSIFSATLYAGVIALAFYYILFSLNQDAEGHGQVPTLLGLEANDDQLPEFDLEQLVMARDDNFENRLREWESFSKPKLDSNAQNISKPTQRTKPVRKTRNVVAAPMPANIDEAFDKQDTQALSKWFADNQVNVIDAQGRSALIKALEQQDHELLEQLLALGADTELADRTGKTPLTYASINGDTASVRKLLKSGANPNSRSKFKKTPLMAAAHNGHFEICELLLKANANPNLEDHSGWTALFYSIWSSQEKIRGLLIQHGANSKHRDHQGVDVGELAKARP